MEEKDVVFDNDVEVKKDNDFNNEDNITLMRNFTVDEIDAAFSQEENTNLEDMIVKDKKRLNKKMLVIILGSILLVIIILLLLYFFVFNKDSKDDQNKPGDGLVDDNGEASDDRVVINVYKNKDNTYSFTSEDGEIIWEYECENKECVGLLSIKDYAIVKDGDKSFIYNYTFSSKIASDLEIKEAKVIENKDGLYGFLLVSNSNKYGIFNISQKAVTVPLVYDNILSLDDRCDSALEDDNIHIIDDLLKVVQGEKYGVVDAKLYNSVIAIDYDNVCMAGGNLYTINNKLKFIYSMDGKKLLNGAGYDDIYAYSDKGYAIVKNKENIDLIAHDNVVISNMTTYNSDTTIYKYGFVSNVSINKAYVILKDSSNGCVEYYYDFSSEAMVIDTQSECDD